VKTSGAVGIAVSTSSEVFVGHRNARLRFYGRPLLVQRVRDQQLPVAHVARAMGISRQCAHRWVARYDAEGEAGLHDRSSRPHRMPTRTSAEIEALVVAGRLEHRRGQDWLGPELGVPARTVSRILRRRACQVFCVSRARLSDGEPSREVDGERVECSCPAVGAGAELAAAGGADVADGEVEDLQHSVLGREVPAGLGDLAELVVEALDGVGIRYEIWGTSASARGGSSLVVVGFGVFRRNS
jgi:transposase-like protein